MVTEKYIKRLKEDKDVEGLIKALKKSEPRVKRLIISALCEIGGDRSLDALCDIAENDNDPIARLLAVKALGDVIDIEDIEYENIFYLISNIAENDKNLYMRSCAIDTLGKMGDPEALDLLLNIAEDNLNNELRPIAVNALGELGDQRALHALSMIAKRTIFSNIRHAAMEAIKKIKSSESKKRLPDLRVEHKIKRVRCPVTLRECTLSQVRMQNKYFVSHSFKNDDFERFKKAIDEALGETGLKPYYSDRQTRKSCTLCSTCEQIRGARFGIYNISNQSPGVTLEVGLAFGFRMPALVTAEKGSEAFSYLSRFNIIEYEDYQNLARDIRSRLRDLNIRF